MKSTACLTEARAKIAEPEHWTKRALARDVEGKKVDPGSEEACKFCALGAVYASCPSDSHARASAFYFLDVGAGRVSWMSPNLGAIAVNDAGTHEQVLAMFDAAIEENERYDRTRVPSSSS